MGILFDIEQASLEDLGNRYGFNGKNAYTHQVSAEGASNEQGMLMITESILESLEESQILPALLHNMPSLTDIEISYSIRSHITSFTRLIITGHSLGGGVASLLSLALQRDFPNTCYSFDPPRQTISPSLLPNTLSNTFTTVMGDDLFPRFSAQTYINLQDDIVSGLCHCKKTKLELYMCLLPWSHPTLQDLFYSDDSEIPAEKLLYENNWKNAVCTQRKLNDRERLKSR